jgi:hypothetical protein
MNQSEQLAIFQQGVQAWNAWYEAHLEPIPDFSELDFRGMDLRYDTVDALIAALKERVIAPAEAKVQEIEERRKAFEAALAHSS